MPRALPPERGRLSLTLPGTGAVEVALRESPRARLARLQVDPAGAVTLVVPRRTSRAAADRLLRSRSGWLERQLRHVAERRAAPGVLHLAPGRVPLAGASLAVERQHAGAARVRLGDDALVIAGPAAAAVGALERWYRREARGRLAAAVDEHAPLVGAAPSAIAVRDQRTRWGSCSRRGTLSFSWRLVLAPPAVLAYVVVHELCHLREHHHGPAFWRLVAAHEPAYREHARWLAAHGVELLAFEPASAL